MKNLPNGMGQMGGLGTIPPNSPPGRPPKPF